MSAVGDFEACVVKGCPWRGTNPQACPMHETEAAWDQQGQLMQGIPSRQQTRHRR